VSPPNLTSSQLLSKTGFWINHDLISKVKKEMNEENRKAAVPLQKILSKDTIE
jgi:hypothetical protein